MIPEVTLLRCFTAYVMGSLQPPLLLVYGTQGWLPIWAGGI